MRNMLMKAAALAAAGVMMLTMPSCGNKQDSSDTSGTELTGDNGKDYADSVKNASEDEMPYGATIFRMEKEYDPEALITTEFDRRFFEERDETYPEIHKIINYMYALNTVDADLMEKSFYPPYLKKMCEDSGASDVKSYIQQYHDSLESRLGEGFNIDYMEVIACTDETDPDTAEYFAKLDEALDSLGEGKISDKVTSRRMATIGGYSTFNLNGEGTYVLMNRLDNEINFAIYEIDGEYWLV